MPFWFRGWPDSLVIYAINRGMTTCKKIPYGFNTRKVKQSPFRTLIRAKKTYKNYKNGRAVGFTARSSLKSMGLVPRSSGCYVLGSKYQS
jgi:hypothetical protein